MGDSKSEFDAAAEIQVRFEEAARATENLPIVKFSHAIERARARRSSSAMEPDSFRSSIAMPTVKESERITLVEALAILERRLLPALAKIRLGRAFVEKALDQEPLFAFPYDEAEIDWATGSVKIPRKREHFSPTFRRAEFERYFFKVAMTSPMTDAEIRGRLLKHFYELRNSNDGWVPTSEIILSPDQVSRQAIANVCQQLAEAGYVQWEDLTPRMPSHAIGRAKITGTGIDVVTGARSPTIDIRFPNIGERDVSAAPNLVPKEPLPQLRKEALNQTIRDKVWRQFEQGHFGTAVFEAMKAVEVAVRDAAGFSAADIGTKLIRKAFDVENGPLTDKAAEQGERQARSDLFAGAIGSYKNPHSHRNVPLDDPDEAAEIIMLANHLLRIVDARAAARSTP